MQTTKTAAHMMGRTESGGPVAQDPGLEKLYEDARPAFDSEAEMAGALRMDAEQLAHLREGRWRPGEEQLQFLGVVASTVTDLRAFLAPSAIRNFLHGNNIRLDGRPLDALRWGRYEEVREAVEALRTGSFA